MKCLKIKKLIPLLAILGIGLILRIYDLTARALWHDEAFSALLIKYNFKEMIDRIILDVHPPFYYIALRGWSFFFGDSLFSLRMFSVLFSLLIILAVYLLIKEISKNEKVSLFACFLVALNSFQIQYAQEARMYALSAFLIVISSYFLLKALTSKRPSWLYWFLYILTVIPAIYCHYYVFFSILAQFVFVVYFFFKKFKFNFLNSLKDKNFQACLISYFLIAFSYLPWLKIFLKHLSQVEENFWIPAINRWSVPSTIYKLTTGSGIDVYQYRWQLIIFVVVIAGLILYGLKKNKESAKWLIFSLFAVPFVTAAIVSFKTSVYLDRYFIFVSAFYLILLALAVFKIEKKLISYSLILILIFGSLAATIYNWQEIQIKEKPGMAAAAAYLNKEAKSNDKIYVGSSFIYFTFKYYNKTQIQPLLYCPGELSHFSGTALLSPEDILKDFQKGTEKGDIVWMINTTGFGNYQPELPQEWLKEEEKGFQDAYDYQGWIVISKYRLPYE